MRISIIGTATVHRDPDTRPRDEALTDEEFRKRAIAALNGAEIHTDLDGIDFTIEIEHDPHGAD